MSHTDLHSHSAPAQAGRNSPASCIREVLQDYARRGVFRGFSADSAGADPGKFRLVWHGGRAYEVLFDPRRKTLTMPAVLTAVPSRSVMDRRYRQFVAGLSSQERPEHRRIDDSKANVRISNRKGAVTLTLTIKDDHYAYGVRKLINLANETIMVFLRDGPYQDYQAEVLGISLELP
jgi:hypothetical protein